MYNNYVDHLFVPIVESSEEEYYEYLFDEANDRSGLLNRMRTKQAQRNFANQTHSFTFRSDVPGSFKKNALHALSGSKQLQRRFLQGLKNRSISNGNKYNDSYGMTLFDFNLKGLNKTALGKEFSRGYKPNTRRTNDHEKEHIEQIKLAKQLGDKKGISLIGKNSLKYARSHPIENDAYMGDPLEHGAHLAGKLGNNHPDVIKNRHDTINFLLGNKNKVSKDFNPTAHSNLFYLSNEVPTKGQIKRYQDIRKRDAEIDARLSKLTASLSTGISSRAERQRLRAAGLWPPN